MPRSSALRPRSTPEPLRPSRSTYANLAVWRLVVIALDRYPSLFAERVAITPLPFVLALAATWLLACLAVGACAWHAAKLPPAEALRQ